MDWDSFKTALFIQGIDPEAIDACKDFVVGEMSWHSTSAHSQSKTDDLGFAECGDITTFEQGIDALKECQFWSTIDETTKKQNRNIMKFRKDPGNHFKRYMLKTFWITN